MHVTSNPTLVTDYLTGLPTLSINREYQRGGGIWPNRAKSALIETVILGFPMPAMYIHQRYNKETKQPFKELVDGQQRTEALRDFYDGKLRLSGTEMTPRLRGRTLKTLEDEDYQRFMSYSLPIFVFVEASVADVREAFRRLNSFNAVLTPDEVRHSTYHGPFKWFVHGLAARVSEFLLRWNTLTPAQVNRMRDTAVVAEVVYAYMYGIRTTKAQQLNALYSTFEKSEDFEDGAQLGPRIEAAFSTLAGWPWFVSSPLTKVYQVWLLVLAVMHAKKAIPALEEVARGGTGLRPDADIQSSLGELIEALERGDDPDLPDDEDVEGPRVDAASANAAEPAASTSEDSPIEERLRPYREFVAASAEKTNTADTRRTRFSTFMAAVARP